MSIIDITAKGQPFRADSIYLAPLTTFQCRSRWQNSIVDFRALHEIGYGRHRGSDRRTGDELVRATEDYLHAVTETSHDALGKCALELESDYPCPFCLPYGLPFDTDFELLITAQSNPSNPTRDPLGPTPSQE